MQSRETGCTSSEEEVDRIESYSEDEQIIQKSIYPRKISVTFDMNRLQEIPLPGEDGSPGRVLVSMNPIHSPRAVKGVYKYRHPLFSSASVLASKSLHAINGVASVSFAGAWMGYGFHEDGFAAGLEAAGSILQQAGRCFRDAPTGPQSKEQTPRWRLRDKICRALLQIVQVVLQG